MLFDDWRSFVHFILGFACCVLPFVGLLVYFVFVLYEVREVEDVFCKLFDFIEFLLGFVSGYLLLNMFLFFLGCFGFIGGFCLFTI